MSFDTRIMAFAERFLSARSYQFIVEPALADLQFERAAGRLQRAADHLAVLRAVAGGLRDDLIRASGEFLALTLLPAGYYIFFLLICFDVYSISISTGFIVVATMILVLSAGPVMVCFWPERPAARPLN